MTTASYGFTLRKHIGIGYVKHPEGETVSSKFVKEGNYEIEIGGQRYPATVSVKIIIYLISKVRCSLDRYLLTHKFNKNV